MTGEAPVIFADGVMNVAPSRQTARFYLARSNPPIEDQGAGETVVAAQIVMPMAAFVGTALFFQDCLRDFIAGGLVDQTMVDAIKQEMGAAGHVTSGK